MGFAIVYGTITLKLYRYWGGWGGSRWDAGWGPTPRSPPVPRRVLRAFLARAAQRVPYTASGRVLRALGLLLLPPLWFLAAWTVATLENVGRNVPLVVRAQTARGLHFSICSHDRWDYMVVVGERWQSPPSAPPSAPPSPPLRPPSAARSPPRRPTDPRRCPRCVLCPTAELLLLLWGSALCWAARAVPSAFHEPRYMGIALHNELLLSAAFHAVRYGVGCPHGCEAFLCTVAVGLELWGPTVPPYPLQVHCGAIAAPRLDAAALLRPHPWHCHCHPGAALCPKGNVWP